MEYIQFTIASLEESKDVLEEYLQAYFHLQPSVVSSCCTCLTRFFNTLKTGLYLGIEFPYVDKVYRDEYYHYYASKFQHYPRNCIRLSFFEGTIVEEDFRMVERFDRLQQIFRGYTILRPTFPNIIGRSVLSPAIFNGPAFYYCATNYNATINGVRLEIQGFPHASQDGEMMVCSETTIWSIMEYFSRKYSEYSPVLPQQVHHLLNERTFERQLPSSGLTPSDMSYAMKKLGFGVKYYYRLTYGSEFYFILQCYIESGIPVIISLVKDNAPWHIVNMIGRTDFDRAKVQDLLPVCQFANNITVFNFFDLPMDYVLIDDNHPPYRVVSPRRPSAHYGEQAEWKNKEINHLIAPLYKRVYMEADEAKKLTYIVLEEFPGAPGERIVRLFLTSTRSFKNAIVRNSSMEYVLKELLISTAHPRFIWVAELSDKASLTQGKARGMIILDATQPKVGEHAILGYFMDKMYIRRDESGDLNTITLNGTPFDMYSSNLKSF